MNKCSWILRLSFAFSSETAQAANTSTNVLVNILEGSILSITRTTSPVNVSGKTQKTWGSNTGLRARWG